MTMFRFGSVTVSSVIALSLAACATPGQDMKGNVFTADQVNSRQAAKVITIDGVMPAQIQADNSENQRRAQVLGGLLGAAGGGLLGGGLAHHHRLGFGVLGAAGGAVAGSAAGSLVPDQVLVDGVTITYHEDAAGSVFTSTQVGETCEFAPGQALLIEPSPTATRVQPNAQCLKPKQA